MTYYHISSSDGGSTVQMLTNKGWQNVVHFTREDHRAKAGQWVDHQMHLDRQDNA